MVVELANDSFHFDFDKATLRPQNREVLSRIAGVLLVSTGYSLSIHGHTDDVGTAEYNQGLSERRAESVAEYLKSSGIPAELIEVRGFGKNSPRVKAPTKEARQRNRRVEIAIVDSMIHYRGTVPERRGL
jgi:OmpA-OmpF porin, OOP family